MKCPHYARHWFAAWGHVGTRSPVCVRCGAPNPRPLSKDERDEYEALTGRDPFTGQKKPAAPEANRG